jgi:hypothetical protein
MRFHHAAIVCLLSGVCSAVTLETPERSTRTYRRATAAEIDKLIEQLGSDDWRTRDQATRTLVEVGPKAQPGLEKALGSTDAEVRWRASYLLGLLGTDLKPPEHEPARILYKSAAEARAQKGGEEAAKRLYGEVIERFPDTRWARAARERLAGLLGGDEPEPKLDEVDAEKLIAALGSDDWATRQDASLRLAAMGEAVRHLLAKAAEGQDPEVAWRAERLIERLDAVAKPAAPARPRLSLSIPRHELTSPRGTRVPPPTVAAHMDGLVESLGSKDASEVAVARKLLLDFGPGSVGALVRGLETCDEVVGVEIMDLLVKVTGQNLGFSRSRWQDWWDAADRRKE